jgi:tetratricopeptide (TPR) repeat protein
MLPFKQKGALLKAAALSVIFGLIGMGAGRDAYVQLTRTTGATSAADPVALNAQAKQALLAIGNNPSALKQIQTLAQESLALQAVNPTALAIKGIALASTGRQAESKALIDLATRLSRREVLAHLARIEERVAQNDVPGALRIYDTALKVSRESENILFPILLNALSDDGVQGHFVNVVKQKPVWLPGLIGFAANQPTGMAALSQAIRRAGGLPPGPEQRTIQMTIVQALVTQGALQEAKAFFLSTQGAKPQLLTSVEISEANLKPENAPISWQILDVEGAVAVAEKTSKGWHIRLSLNSDLESAPARKLLFLDAGRYQMELKGRFLEAPQSARLRVEFLCVAGNGLNTIWTGNWEALSSKDGRISGTFSIPATCREQFLVLKAAGEPDETVAEIVIESVTLKKSA